MSRADCRRGSGTMTPETTDLTISDETVESLYTERFSAGAQRTIRVENPGPDTLHLGERAADFDVPRLR